MGGEDNIVQKLIAKFNKTDTPEKNKWFYIIDMQNDFIDAPQSGLNGTNECGTFAVAGSGNAQFLNDMADFIKKQAAQPNTYFVVSRDYHPVTHCSFNGTTEWNNIGYSYTEDVQTAIRDCRGQYPPHCIQCTPGAEMNPIIREALEEAVKGMKQADINKRFHVAFKGWHPKADSYGCHPYVRGDDTDKRLPNNTTTTTDFTGGFTLNNKSFEDALIFGKSQTDTISPDSNTLRPFHGPQKDDKIYVFGLAGNFCVQDTATNLKDSNYQDVTILNKYTMYADYSDPTKGSLLKPHHVPIQFTNSNDTRADTSSYLKTKGVHLIHDIGDNRYIHTTRSAVSLDTDRTRQAAADLTPKDDAANLAKVRFRGGKRFRRKNTLKIRQRRR
jgi:nicotinamidase-related amidase